MSTQTNSPNTPEGSAHQESTAASQGQAEQSPQGGGCPAPPVPAPEAPAPEPISGTWFTPADPHYLIHWTLEPARTSPTATASESGSASPTYHATARIYEQIFDTTFPNQTTGPVVPFSVVNPTIGPKPFIQGTFVLSQSPLTLEVMNLRFLGFSTNNLTLYSPASSTPEAAGETAE